MKILYFDINSLLYSKNYIESDNELSVLLDEWRKCFGVNLLDAVPPDMDAIAKLQLIATEAGLLLYPIDPRYNRRHFLERNLFGSDVLAPDADLSIRLGDGDPIRRLVIHASKLDAYWFICGDIGQHGISRHYKNRIFTSDLETGLTDTLLNQILEVVI
ncbi:hypothetical protein [Vibrio bivalvicida]|uniref:PIN domain-containing protein n=1 Tax=Vibrio bivalvicida TaxID=1276888 RepID=A0A177Y0U1_9VIBR|nr:hypothetical protein [Vibrio bivalvicida]OAJ94450.1 hypothetical protein APB76_09725 [Vibrio bivalvicida]